MFSNCIAFSACFLSPINAAEFQVLNTKVPIIIVSGKLKLKDEKKFIAKILNIDQAVVVLNSTGGNLVAGLEIGKAIHLKNFSTYVPADTICASACALAWLGGKEAGLPNG